MFYSLNDSKQAGLSWSTGSALPSTEKVDDNMNRTVEFIVELVKI